MVSVGAGGQCESCGSQCSEGESIVQFIRNSAIDGKFNCRDVLSVNTQKLLLSSVQEG